MKIFLMILFLSLASSLTGCNLGIDSSHPNPLIREYTEKEYKTADHFAEKGYICRNGENRVFLHFLNPRATGLLLDTDELTPESLEELQKQTKALGFAYRILNPITKEALCSTKSVKSRICHNKFEKWKEDCLNSK